MKVNIPLPFDTSGQFSSMAAVRRTAAAAERAGFYAGIVTDHPCPTSTWLETGGHRSQGPFVMLALVAAVTERLRLMTSILVLPYRNPFIVARDVATLDSYSGGRTLLGVGAGYLEDEFRALGVAFDKRNEMMDEYLRALRASLTGEPFTFVGTGYEAVGNRIMPGPVQMRLPIYVGGNSKKAIRRVVDLCDGWNPFFTVHNIAQSKSTHTASITGIDDLKIGIAYMRDYAEETGRADMPEVILGSVNTPQEKLSDQQAVDRIAALREIGVTAVGMRANGRDAAEWSDDAERIGAMVLAKFDA